MPRRNRNAWRNDQARAAVQHDVIDLNRRRRRGKRGRRLEQQPRRAA